ncbi:MAG: molybdopterin-binding protein [Actinomycetota bacterium]|nr:molybdopterin-binding protein [Actinomycetota bacterium]
MSTYGLEGVLAWSQAMHVAMTAGRALPVVTARLDEAGGNILGRDLTLLFDDPPADSAQFDGYAICGEGPWLAVDEDRLRPGECQIVRRGQSIALHTDAVLRSASADVRRAADGTLVVIALDELTGVVDEQARPALGLGIIRQAARAKVGASLVPAGRVVNSPVLALAAAAGHDNLDIIRPPVVGTLVLGRSLLSHGLPRDGRIRDALGDAVADFAGRQGARAHPPVRAPDTAALLREHIADADVDVLITTGSTAPGPDNHVREVMRDLGARWLVDGVAVWPGAQMLLARLPDGRLLVGLPGDPAAALAGLVTIVRPLLRALRGAEQESLLQAVMIDDVEPGDFADDTHLVPVLVDRSGPHSVARALPGGFGGLEHWANADGVAVIAPHQAVRGQAVQILPL